VLVPLSFVFAIVLLAAGVIDNSTRHKSCRRSPSVSTHSTGAAAQQSIPGGPVASMCRSKMIGDNGGGYSAPIWHIHSRTRTRSSNSAHHLAGRGNSVRLPVGLRPLVGSMRQATVVIVAMVTL